MATTLQIETPEWAVESLLQPHRYKGLYGGRGSGKSHFIATEVIEALVYNPNLRIICIREVQSSIKFSVKHLLESKIRTMGVESYFDIQEAQIKSAKGSGVIVFVGMQTHTADTIKSFEGFDICWCEEAQSLSQRSLDLLRPTIRKKGSQMWFTWNPRFETDAIDMLLRPKDGEALPDDAVVVRVNFTDNPWFPEELRKEMEFDKRRDPDKYAHIWLGEYEKNSEARVFHNWRIEEFVAPDGVLHRLGSDWGYSKDPTVMVRNHVIGNNLYIDYEAYEIGCEIDDVPTLFMTNVPGAEKYRCTADNNRPDTISYMKRHGFPNMYPATKGNKSLYEGVEFLKIYDIIIHPRCKHTIDEFTLYSWKVCPHTGRILPVLADKKNHVIDSIRYSDEIDRRAAKQKKKIPVNPIPRASAWN